MIPRRQENVRTGWGLPRLEANVVVGPDVPLTDMSENSHLVITLVLGRKMLVSRTLGT